MIVLHIDSSPRGADSVSRDLTREIVNRLKAVEPTLDVVRYDLGDRPLPHLRRMRSTLYAGPNSRPPNSARSARCPIA